MEEKEVEHLVEEKLRNHTYPLSKEDFSKVKEVLDHHGRMRWLWGTLKIWILAGMTVISFLTIGLDGVRKILRDLIS